MTPKKMPSESSKSPLSSEISTNGTITEHLDEHPEPDLKPDDKDEDWGKLQWHYISFYAVIHLLAVHGLWVTITGQSKWQTMVSAYIEVIMGTLGILAGAHRLWAHRSYKAKLPLRIFLAIANSLGFMYSIWHWARDHRQHHKFSDTHADPHNAGRGFFYSHIGWLFWEKHPDCYAKHACIDTSDLNADPVVAFQYNHYKKLAFLIWAFLPTFIPVYFWDESLLNAFTVCVAFRYAFTCHNIFLINSAAHLYGTKPYSARMKPCENLFVSFMSLGEGYHNYHHNFPRDYSASELGWNHSFNPSSFFIEMCERLGLAYDLKKPSPESVKSVSTRLGDGTYEEYIKTVEKSFGVKQCWTALMYFAAPILGALVVRYVISSVIEIVFG